jgi:hypothetical protein
MTKLDLALISQQGYGQRVPKEMDRHMVKFVVGQRKTAVETALANNDNSPFVTNRWDHSDVFYQTRTWLNQHGWDTSVYNDDVAGGSDRRKNFYDMIQGVCEDYYHIKRHQIGIYPADRAVMAFKGSEYSVGFDQRCHSSRKMVSCLYLLKATSTRKRQIYWQLSYQRPSFCQAMIL